MLVLTPAEFFPLFGLSFCVQFAFVLGFLSLDDACVAVNRQAVPSVPLTHPVVFMCCSEQAGQPKCPFDPLCSVYVMMIRVLQ